jgi:hypothetical protein
MQITFNIDFKDAAKALSEYAPKQVKFAMAKTLTALAQDGRDAIIKQMPVSFDRPTSFTLRAPSFEKATPATQESRVYIKDSQDAAGKSINEHLRPEAIGTPARHQKKTEFLLTRLGFLPAGWVTTPGKAMPQDVNGNMPGSYYKQIVNVLQLKPGSRYASGKGVSDRSQKKAKRFGVPVEIFCVAPGKNTMAKGGGWLPPGVYQHLPGRKLRQMLKFVRKASYAKLLDVEKIVTEVVTTNAEKRWAESVDFALLTAKP